MTADTTRFCGSCGAPRGSVAVKFCPQCGTSFAAAAARLAWAVGFSAPAAAVLPERARRRPQRLVALLAFFSSATYAFFWLWMSWRELKLIQGERTMRPFWHAVAALIPLYGLFRFHAHFRVLDDLLGKAGASVRAGAGLLTLIYFLVTVTLYFSISEAIAGSASGTASTLTPWSLLVVATAYAYIVGTGQAALNAYYRSVPGIDVPERGHAFEWIFLVVFAATFTFQLALSLQTARLPF